MVLLYYRYVDDISVCCPPIKPGWFYSKEEKELKYDPDQTYSRLPEDQRTLSVLRDIAE